MSVVFLILIGTLFSFVSTPSLMQTIVLFMLCFAALGAGNGAPFQLVPVRWPLTTAVAGGMIGEIGPLGGSILPNLLAQSKERTGTFGRGFIAYAIFAAMVLIMLRIVSRRWVKSWAGPGGRSIVPATVHKSQDSGGCVLTSLQDDLEVRLTRFKKIN